MDNQISVFNGALNPNPIDATSWQDAIDRIQSDRYKEAIEKARAIKDPEAYREHKKKLPAVTFSGCFKKRNRIDVISTTGFLTADLDHLKDIEAVFRLLKQDRAVWWCFRSPSGDGLKAGIRAKGIDSDQDIKKLYQAVEWYFLDLYGIKIDPACKDISRLTFVSHDPHLFVNPDPQFFDIKKWTRSAKVAPRYDPPESMGNGWKEKYGLKVLESSCEKIRNSQPGEQHHLRLKMARLLGGFIPEFVSENDAMDAIEAAVSASGAKNMKAAMKTIADGLAYGKSTPITVENNFKPKRDIEYYFDLDENVSNVSNVSNGKRSKRVSANVSSCKQENEKEPPHNLAAHIKEWITNSTGSFTVDQVDREFCLTTRREKNNRSRALNRYIELELIRRDPRIKGKYWVIDSELEFDDLLAADPNPFPILLPFNLHNYVNIPKKAVIILAGTSNAGKTALALNIFYLNFKQEYDLMYLYSEMGRGELKHRISSFGDGELLKWSKRVKSASKYHDFDGAIRTYNKDGLTCIDFLEEIQGEYHMLPSQIRDIYDALGEGVALINLQKKSKSEFAVGGENTIQKARLYLILDLLTVKEASIICALKAMKVKDFKNKNLQYHEIHFELTKGARLTPLNDWTLSSKIDRHNCIRKYENAPISADTYCADGYLFKTAKGPVVTINSEHAGKWQQTFSHIDVNRELERISRDSFKKPFIKYDGYFFQIPGILAKINEKRGEQ